MVVQIKTITMVMHIRGHICYLVMLKPSQNVCVNDITDKFETLSTPVKDQIKEKPSLHIKYD